MAKKNFFITLIFISLINNNIFAQKKRQINWIEIAEKTGAFYGVGEIDRYPKKILTTNQFKSYLKETKNYIINNNKKRPEDIDNVSIRINSTSFLKSEKFNYRPQNIFDGNINTFWCEGAKGDGFKEKIEINYEFKVDKKGIYHDGVGFSWLAIFPGNGKSDKLFYANNRPKTILLIAIAEFENGFKHLSYNKVYKRTLAAFRLRFTDKRAYHLFSIENPLIIAKKVKFIMYIEEVYKGKLYDDTCISEVSFLLPAYLFPSIPSTKEK